jgi:hypothetical protein
MKRRPGFNGRAHAFFEYFEAVTILLFFKRLVNQHA